MLVHEIMEVALEQGASDIHLAVNSPPVLRVDGEMVRLDEDPMSPAETEAAVKAVAPDEHINRLEEVGGSDFGYAHESGNRMRVAIFRQQKHVGMVMRIIPDKIFTFDELGLPSSLKEICAKPRGIVLVTGPTGSGKTTTLAAFIDYVNRNFSHHIITIEDPIEFTHPHRKSVITQRELGVDVLSFSDGIRSALRMDPAVMLVGEMRDQETIGAAITAAETGHLVFATLHTNSAAQTVNRIIDTFPQEEQSQVRSQLSITLAAVISQTLMPKQRGTGRIAAFEIMVSTPGIANLIRETKEQNIPSAIQTGGNLGMQTLDQHLAKLYQRGLISYDQTIANAQNPEELKQKL
ncbi:MAG: type IV pilus twitching motility protein PilT [bacterium]